MSSIPMDIEGAKESSTNHRPREISELLLNISKEVNSFETLDEVFECLVRITTNVLGAERSTIFLYNEETKELYSHVAQGDLKRKIRIFANRGIAGHVFNTGEAMLTNDANSEELFYSEIDKTTGFITKSILCVPIKTFTGDTLGVVEVLNKKEGDFTDDDMLLLKEISQHASVALKSSQMVEKMKLERARELEFLDVVIDITSEYDLSTVLDKVMSEVTRMLNAERSTFFLNDEKTSELWSEVGHGIDKKEIRFPNDKGIAGTVFTTGDTVNIPYAYADLRFNRSFDAETGFFTRSVLCCPMANKEGKIIGVTQVLNKRGGVFTDDDEIRLKAFSAHASIALENAKLFSEIETMKNYNESMLDSLSNGVMAINEDGLIVSCNDAACRILQTREDNIVGVSAEEFFSEDNKWVVDKLRNLEEDEENRAAEYTANRELIIGSTTSSVNLTVLPLMNDEKKKIGSMVVIEDISSEKRMKSTMSRYMDPALADQLLSGENEDILGGSSVPATVLFSDIRDFTSLTEELGAQGTVSLLNEYFTIMVDCIQREGGMLDKFIGDAIMASFGIPFKSDDDEDRAIRASINMIRELNKWNLERAARGERAIDMGIGLNTDTIVSGNIGSPKRMDYTMIGDGVNLAARLESSCKKYHAKILVSGNTFNKLHGTYRIRNIDDVVVKGKSEPVAVYEVLDYHTEETFPNLMEAVSYFADGRELYKKGEWNAAIKCFEKALMANPNDELSMQFIDRCDHLRANPPGNNWNGVWVMKSK